MTDDERQKLCAALRAQITEGWFYLDSEDACHGIVRPMGEVAADEIERLAALAQSGAEPVAWQTRAKDSEDWYIWQCEDKPDIDPEFYEARLLYTAPPRPDVSAGLIEAAEAELNQIRDCMIEDRSYYDGLIDFAGDIEKVAAMLRACAADRSETPAPKGTVCDAGVKIPPSGECPECGATEDEFCRRAAGESEK